MISTVLTCRLDINTRVNMSYPHALSSSFNHMATFARHHRRITISNVLFSNICTITCMSMLEEQLNTPQYDKRTLGEHATASSTLKYAIYLHGAEISISEITKSGQDVLLGTKTFVNMCSDNCDRWESLDQCLNTLWSSDDAYEYDLILCHALCVTLYHSNSNTYIFLQYIDGLDA